MFAGIEHFAIASPNPEKLAHWYVEHLQFRINHEYAGNYFVKAQNGVVIEIVPAEGDRTPAAMRTPGMRHIAVAVDDFDAAYQQLKAEAVEFAGEPFMNQGNRLVFFKDGDGNLVHLIHRPEPLP